MKLLEGILDHVHKSKYTIGHGVSPVIYYGHMIDAEGLYIYTVLEKVQAVHDAPSPSDVVQLTSNFGFLPLFSTVIHSSSESVAEGFSALEVDESRGTGIPGSKQLLCVGAFQSLRDDPVLQCIIVWHCGSVVALVAGWDRETRCFHISQTLTPAVKKYPQIKKEA